MRVGGGEQRDQILGDVERLDGTDAQALDRGLVEDFAEEIGKFDTRGEVAAVGAEIYAAEDDFAMAGLR